MNEQVLKERKNKVEEIEKRLNHDQKMDLIRKAHQKLRKT